MRLMILLGSFPASSSIAISSFKQSYFVEPETNNIQDSFPSKLSITVSVLFFQPAHQLAFFILIISVL